MSNVCPRCGAEVTAQARFCAACGAPLELGAAAERKLATMVFADVVGSTEMAAGIDPEELRGRLAPFFDIARTTLEDHGGTIEKFIGDAVMAVFGVPVAHGDDPDRAVAASLVLLDRVRTLDAGIQLRIGIETGEVLATGRDGDLSVTGEAVNAAARLQQAAQPGQILVGDRTARAARRTQLQAVDPVDAKGMPAPLTAWRVVAALDEAEAVDVPLLGREDDLELLRIVYRRAVRERAPQLVTITGEAGIGKTRLAMELVRKLEGEAEPPRVLVGRNPPYGRGIAFWALGEILRDAAGASADDPVSAVRSGLTELVRSLGAGDADEIAGALTVPLGGSNGADESGAEEVLRKAWRRLVALLAAERPLVIAVDDAHWADSGLLDLLEEVAFRLQDAPLVVLCTARPELHERRPDFGRSTRNVTQMELRPLSGATATELVELLLPSKARDMAPRLAQASGGNPFFAEEVARSVSEEASRDMTERLPDTVQAAVAARMDLLPGEEKRALQYAAVLGQGFEEQALARLLGAPPGEALAGLERKALVQERATGGSGRYAFRHQLIRDVAYGALPRSERARLHIRAAEGIREMAADRMVELAELVAFHLGEAADLTGGEEQNRAAYAATIEAAEVAVRRGGPSRAQHLFEHAASLDVGAPAQVNALSKAAIVAVRRMRGDQGLALLRRAAALAEESGDRREAAAAYAHAVELGARMAGITGHLPEDEAVRMLERGRELAPADAKATHAQLLLDEAWIAWRYQHSEEMKAPAEEGLRLAREVGDPALVSGALDAVSGSRWFEGRYQDSLAATQERAKLIEGGPDSSGLEFERTDVSHMLIETLMQVGRFREAKEVASKTRELDLSSGLVYSGWSRGLLPTFFLGEWDEHLQMAARVREAWLAEERPPLAVLATAMGAAGAIQGFRDDPASEDSFEFAQSVAMEGAQNGGVQMLRSQVDLHRGRYGEAAQRLAELDSGFWWHAPYLAVRAESFVLAGHPEAEEAIRAAEPAGVENPYAGAIILRAKGIFTDDPSLIEQSRRMMAEVECPYQEARSAWRLGGEARHEAAAILERLGATPLPD